MRIVFVIAITMILLGMSYESSESKVRKQVVKLFGVEGGSCSGIKVAHKKKYYTLTAAHCRGLESNNHIQAMGPDKKLLHLEVLFEDPNSDLLVLSNPSNTGIEIADTWEQNERVFTITHGDGKPAYRTDGELLNIEFISIPIFSISETRTCKIEQPKYNIRPGLFGLLQTCYMSYWGVWSTAKVVPGSSGGSVLNLDGNLIGIVSAANSDFSIFVTLEDIKRALNKL